MKKLFYLHVAEDSITISILVLGVTTRQFVFSNRNLAKMFLSQKTRQCNVYK